MTPHVLFGEEFDLSTYRKVDLSVKNPNLGNALVSPKECQHFLDNFLKQNSGKVAFGGYMERRGLYGNFVHFNPGGQQDRDIHLGVDFWAPAGTGVYAPWDGKVHSWANRDQTGDYGPVILLEHQLRGKTLYTLFGHLSTDSLEGLAVGRKYLKGDRLGSLGGPRVNGGYAPHLHFQLIKDLEGYRGDYPGVSSLSRIEFYRENCPDPMIFLSYFQGSTR